MIAAEKTGRRARVIEIDPLYCDLIVKRWQQYTGKQAYLSQSKEPFQEVALRRERELRRREQSNDQAL
jgi:DNA modification methylase